MSSLVSTCHSSVWVTSRQLLASTPVFQNVQSVGVNLHSRSRLSTVTCANRYGGGTDRRDRDDDRSGSGNSFEGSGQRYGTSSGSNRGGLAPGNRGDPPAQSRGVAQEREQNDHTRFDINSNSRNGSSRRETGPGSIGIRSSNNTDSSSGGSSGSGTFQEHLTSTSNAYVKHCAALRTSSKARAASRTFLLVGADLIWEAVGKQVDRLWQTVDWHSRKASA